MSNEGSITCWIDELRSGNPDAAAAIWQRYYPQLVRLAQKKLRDAPRRVADEEDVVVDAFDSFCRGVQTGRFPQLNDRDDLWQVLVMLTARKAVNQFQHARRAKRGGGLIRGESAFQSKNDDLAGIEQVVGLDPTPEFAEMVSQEMSELLSRLGDETLRRIAVAKLEGYQNAEIAANLGVQPRTIERKLHMIREIWSADGGEMVKSDW